METITETKQNLQKRKNYKRMNVENKPKSGIDKESELFVDPIVVNNADIVQIENDFLTPLTDEEKKASKIIDDKVDSYGSVDIEKLLSKIKVEEPTIFDAVIHDECGNKVSTPIDKADSKDDFSFTDYFTHNNEDKSHTGSVNIEDSEDYFNDIFIKGLRAIIKGECKKAIKETFKKIGEIL